VTKINSDGEIQVALGVAGISGVARDSNCFHGAISRSYEGIDDPLTIEGLALRDVVKISKTRQFQRVLCEVDCADLVRQWHDMKKERSLISPILDDISLLSSSFESFSIVSSRCEANQAAHLWAKFACTQMESVYWIVEPPDFLVHSLAVDCSLDEV
jgi:hypothetical protein